MATVLDAVIQLKDNFSSTLQAVEKNISGFSRTAKAMGRDIQRTGRNLQRFGGKLTRSITLPVVGATTAAAGLVATLGWSRLTGLDAAQAQLKGLGYEIEDVKRIADQVRTAVQGTVVTMAEGTSVAAGALAAGVKEGEELEKYIRLVGSAAVGANRPVEDMAMIFNRVQGQGKLMTQELNMIEQGMPGFAAAMAKHYKVPLAEFRKMVTDGKVSSKNFLGVMEDFAGGMAEAYANSWAGMIANVKSNIGIIGETLLGGVFEQSKESIAEFLEFLRSDEARDWAQKIAKPVGETFSKVVNGIKGMIDWFANLDSGTKKLIGKIALAAVAAGPVISVIGKMTDGVGRLVFNFGKFAGRVKSLGLMGAIFTPGVKVALVIGLIVAAVILLIKNWDKVKAKVDEVFPNMKEQIQTTMEHVKNIFGGVVNFLKITWSLVAPIFTIAWEIIKSVFLNGVEYIGSMISNIIRVISGIVTFLTGVFTLDWELAWQGIVDIFGGIFGGLGNLAKAPLNGIIALVNGVIGGLNKIKLPDWVPGLGGKGINIPLIPKLAKGTNNWGGGIAQIHERGGEIIDLPGGSRVYPHDESVSMARKQGRKESGRSISIAKLADQIIVREEADIDKIATAIVRKIEQVEFNMA